MSDIKRIAPIVINSKGATQYVNVYGLDSKGDVYIWDAVEGRWVFYSDEEMAKAFTPPKEK